MLSRGFYTKLRGVFGTINHRGHMSALEDIDVGSVAALAMSPNAAADSFAKTGTAIPPEVVGAVKQEIGALFWRWYHDNADRKVAHVHVWFFSRDVYVRDLHDAFTLLFGAEPTTDANQPAQP